MALIVLPLAAALMWLGWRAVDQLEARSVEHRMAALDAAVEGFISSGLHVIVAVGTTLAANSDFSLAAGSAADGERARQMIAALKRYSSVAALFVGHRDGHFIYAGRPETFSEELRREYGTPPGQPLIVRTVQGEGAARRETWWFELPSSSP